MLPHDPRSTHSYRSRIRTSRSRLTKRILTSAPAFFDDGQIDQDTKIVFVSDACETLLGYRADEITGTQITDYIFRRSGGHTSGGRTAMLYHRLASDFMSGIPPTRQTISPRREGLAPQKQAHTLRSKKPAIWREQRASGKTPSVEVAKISETKSLTPD